MTLAPVEPSSSGTTKIVIAAGAVVIVQAACFVYFLNRFSYLPGADAYYYAVQTQSLVDFGHLKVADGGVLHYFLAALCRCGMPIAMAFKAALAAIFCVYNLGVLLVVLRLRQNARLAALVLWLIGGPAVAFHVIEFPELSLGLALVPLWFWLLASSFKRRTLWLAVALAASAMTHVAAAALALLFAAVALAASARVHGRRRKRPAMTTVLLGFAACAAVLIAVALKWTSLKLRLAALRPGAPGIVALTTSADIPVDMKFTLLVFWLFVLVLFVLSFSGEAGKWKYLSAATLALPLWPSHEAGLAGLGGRLAALFVFPALPLAMQMCDEFAPRLNFAPLFRRSLGWVLALSAAAGVAFLPARLSHYDGLLMSDDYTAYEKVVSTLRKADIPMLIAHRGLDFFYSYRLGRDAFHFDPEPEWKRAEIWRVAMRITPEEVAYYSPPSCPWGETARSIPGTDYILVREDCWEQLRARIQQSDNPDLYVEVWGNMENPSQPRPRFLRLRHAN
jgi:hypothetical protein